MQKHPSSLAVLAEVFVGIGSNFLRVPVVLQEYWWKADEIKTDRYFLMA
jgi:hypothetical protein